MLNGNKLGEEKYLSDAKRITMWTFRGEEFVKRCTTTEKAYGEVTRGIFQSLQMIP